MNVLVEDLVLVSIDDHIVEPPNLFDGHVPARFSSQAPKVVRLADGFEAWEFQGEPVGMLGLNSVVSWPKDEWGMDPTGVAEMRPGAYDVHERVRDMNRNGVLASMCFPTMPGFSGRIFQEAPDHDLSLIMLKAYNDWHIDEWCASYPGRFLPNAIGPIWDPSLLADEVRRVAAKGCLAISMPELPHLQHLPGYGSDYWDPFFAACCDEGVVMNLHIGQGLNAISLAPDSPAVDCMLVLATQVSTLSVQDLLWGPALRKYPGLKIAWSEGGIGWVPFMLDRVDRQYQNQTWTGQDFGGKLPSDVFREHALTCFTSDPTSLKLYDEIGIDIIAFETDYPHSDCSWPSAPEELLAQCESAKIPDGGIDKIAWKNACRFYNYDPFAVVGREEGTVGALRALATDVSVETVSKHEWRARYDANPLYTIEDAPDVAAMAWRT
jgi:predicted TIM-barrel fold metal-dependent hydrolase